MAPTTPAAARADLFDLLGSDTVKGTPRSTDLERIYQYEVASGEQVRSTKGVVSISMAQELDETHFAFDLTIYTDFAKGVAAAEAAMDVAWWAVEQLLDTSSQFTRGLWAKPFVAEGLNALVRQTTVSCVRGAGSQGI